MARLTGRCDSTQRCWCHALRTHNDGRDERATAALEVLDRATSAARSLEAITTGKWRADAETLDAVARLVRSAARWAEIAEAA